MVNLNGKRSSERNHGHWDQNFQIAPVLSGNNLARRGRNHHDKKRAVDDCGNDPAEMRRASDGKPARQPDQHKRQQRRPLQRKPARPVWNGRQQKAGEHRRHITEQHFMGVPVARREQRRKCDLALEQRQPDRDRERRMTSPEEEKRAKAIREERWALDRL